MRNFVAHLFQRRHEGLARERQRDIQFAGRGPQHRGLHVTNGSGAKSLLLEKDEQIVGGAFELFEYVAVGHAGHVQDETLGIQLRARLGQKPVEIEAQ